MSVLGGGWRSQPFTHIQVWQCCEVCRLPTKTLRTSVQHTDAFSGVVQRDTTIHQSIAAKVATGFELGNSLDQERFTTTRRTAEPNSASCWDRIDGAASQAQSIGAKQ